MFAGDIPGKGEKMLSLLGHPLVVILFILVAVCLAVWLTTRKTGLVKGDKLVISGIGSLLVSAIVCSWVGVVLVGSSHMILDKDNTIVVDVNSWKNTLLLWKSDERLEGTIVSYASRNLTDTMTVRPITQNPRVHEIGYEVGVSIMGTPQSYFVYQKDLERIEITDQWLWLKYHLREFNADNSRDLAQFDNEYDDKQQEAFRDMMRKYFDELGATLDKASFWLP